MLPSLKPLTKYIHRYLCTPSDQQCFHSASLLNIADTVDVDYDSISHTLTFTAHWSRPPAVLYDPVSGNVTENAWSVTVHSSPNAQKVEVGVLSNEAANDACEINLSGFLAVLGEDDRPKPTLFSFPSRHHAIAPSQAKDQSYSVSFLQPTGLHPTMQISFPTASALQPPVNKPTDSVCALHTYLTLPSALFADKYQLSTTDTPFLQNHHLTSLRSISGETDLEAADYVVEKWGSNLLLELATPTSSSNSPDSKWNITIPLHLRYLSPAPSGQTPLQIPYPILFWACTADEGTKFPVNPFDRVNLGYEGLFGGRTMFYHLEPALPSNSNVGKGLGGKGMLLVETLQAPVLDTQAWAYEWVELGTVASVLLGFWWVVWKLGGLALLGWIPSRGGRGKGVDGKAQKEEKEEEEKTNKKKQ
jgi:PIG-X / PBN1